MTQNVDIWKLSIFCTPEQESLIEEAFADVCVAASSLLTAQENIHELEILFDGQPDRQTLDEKLKKIAEETGKTLAPYRLASLGNLDWIKKVATELEPIEIARWTIFGAAFREAVSDKDHRIQIDATSAFGTGEHPTTRGCLLMLDDLLLQTPYGSNARMLDMGCGSAILAMAFAQATGGQALGIDMDADSVLIAKENVRVNDLMPNVRIENGEGYTNPIIAENGPYDLIMANVFADPLCDMAADLRKNLKIGGHAILSGILNEQAERVMAAHRQQGLTVREIKEHGAWSVLALTLASDAS